MTATITPVKSSIAEKAMLVNLQIKTWGATKEDQDLSRETARNHGSDEKFLKTVKKLLDSKRCPTYAKLKSLTSAARDLFYEYTLPWNDGGIRILPSAQYMEFTSKLATIRNEFESAVPAFIDAYPNLKAEASFEMNGLFKDDDWPEAAKLAKKFAIRAKFMPLADASDFRTDLGAAEEALLKQQWEADMHKLLNRALADVFRRLRECVKDMTDRVGAFETTPDGKSVKSFRDSAVDNLRELVASVPKLNVTNEPLLTEITDSIRQLLCTHDAQVLRDNYVVRNEVVANAKQVQDVLANVESYFGGDE